MKKINLLLVSALLSVSSSFSQNLPAGKAGKDADKKDNTKAKATPTVAPILNSETYSSLSFRSIGPAVTSGRIVDLAVNPKNKSEWYIAAGAGGVFKRRPETFFCT